ncbi:MAG: polyphosphate polymerase domain-containing protein [Lachnospiraceae bacterium]|nr:polyphosphate polymerase domain-containing protein [Lachnospiraceae bacterium]
MEQEKHYRHELKYAVSRGEYEAMKKRLRLIMRSDPHTGPDGTYLIRSIYFDNADDKALREKEDGVSRREKFRIRYYNDDLSFITLEKKMKIDSLCLKYDAPITEAECRKIISGDTDFMKDHPDEVVKELYAKMRYQGLRPKVLVSYLREPYIYAAGNVRVTFDSQIRTSLFDSDYLDVKTNISATEKPTHMLLEVKYDAFLPEIIQKLIRAGNIRQQAFSKYGACRRLTV